MKNLVTYINERLNGDIQQWIKNVYKTQQLLIKDNKVKQLQIDLNNLNKPKQPFLYNDFSTDNIIKKLVSDRLTGFTVINQLIKNPKQYVFDEEKQMNPLCFPYWYQDGQNIYMIGICIYDNTVSYIDDYVHLIAIESSLIVESSDELNKAILNDFSKLIIKENKYKGISAKPKHPKMKAILLKLGFTTLKENKDILVYKI